MSQKINNYQLHKILPHTYPFLLIDYVEKFTKGKNLTAIKNITVNEWPFTGRVNFSNRYPEILLIEASAQAALVLYYLTFEDDPNRPLPIIGRVAAEFAGDVSAGDQVRIEVTGGKYMRKGGYSFIDIFHDQQVLARIKIIYGVLPRKRTL